MFWLVKRLPSKLLYYCFLQVMAHSTCGKYGSTIVPELTGMEALKRYEKDKGIHARRNQWLTP
jgi:hypothetical protein